jgi:hypothetical protein
MDPLESVKEFKEQEGRRVVRIAPPPIIPTSPQFEKIVDLVDLSGGVDEVTADVTSPAAHIPGTPRGRKRLLQVYLPVSTRYLLDDARKAHTSLGAAAMTAMRGSYEHIVTNYTPEPVEGVGPFPAPRAPRRREHVDDARMRAIYVDPAEAAAIEELADQCELSISELVTIAIDHHYGQPAPSSRARKDQSA